MTAQLHVPSLSIEGFRGIQSLALPQLGRVTLLAGENGVGKTTVLDAFRFYAARGDGRVLMDLLETREEFVAGSDEDGDSILYPDFRSLFHSIDGVHDPEPIRLQAESDECNLSVRLVESGEGAGATDLALWEDQETSALEVFVGKCSRTVVSTGPMFYNRSGTRKRVHRLRQFRQSSVPADAWPSPIRQESLGPGLLDNDELARLWDAVTLTDGEDLATEALRLVMGEDLVRLNVIGDTARPYGDRGRRAVAKLGLHSTPVPLKRFGDGANRLLAIALGLANSRDGILLIDEVENGIHYSVQSKLWQMVFHAAEAANVQVVAATHSWDCIAGFAAAAVEFNGAGTLFRLERFGGELHPVLYSAENLKVAASQRIEVR